MIMNTNEVVNISLAQLRPLQNVSRLGDDMVYLNDTHYQHKVFQYPCRFETVILGLCTQGRSQAVVNLQEYTLGPGSLIFNLPNNILQIKEFSDDFRACTLIISTEFLKDLRIDLKSSIPFYMHIKSQPVTRIGEEDVKTLGDTFGLIHKALDSPREYRKADVIKSLTAALAYQAGAIMYETLPDEGLELPSRSRRDTFFEKFMHLLSENHKTERSMKIYADQLHITPKYLSSLIKEATGRSATEWIDEYVVLEAKTLLKFSDMSIQEIAYYLNFSSQSFFGKYFKHHTGMSPSEYKKI